MKRISMVRQSLFFQFIGTFGVTSAFTAFFPQRYPLLNKNNDVNSKLKLAFDPNELFDQISTLQNLQDSTHILNNAIIDSSPTRAAEITELFSNTLLGFGETQATISQSAQLETLTSLKSVGSSVISPTSPEFMLQNANPSDFAPKELDAEQLEFYAQEVDIFSKLPLAALVYVVFDFFFFNAREAVSQDMYTYDEDDYLDEKERDSPEMIAAFVGQNVFRVFAALIVTYATIFASKMTYHPHF